MGNFSSHSGPWDYLQEVPLFMYGPGHVTAVGKVGRPVTVADIAPTYAELLGFTFAAPDGSPLTEAIDLAAPRPKLILTIVWDGAGRNVLKRYPRSWPNLRGLTDQGAWFERAAVGSSPSVTPAIHSSIGTGAFPRHHGIVDVRFRVAEGRPPTGSRRATELLGPSLADEYDVQNANEPVIGMVGAEGTLGMIGHGTLWTGGDADIAAAMRAGSWGLSGPNSQNYRFPSYVPGLPGYKQIRPAADRQDGRVDGEWFGMPLDSRDSLTYTPAYSHYQTGVIDELIKREGFGADGITDLLYVNYKQVDKVGHRFSFPSRQMGAVVQGVDQALGDLIGILDRNVGRGQWVLAVTADHGSTPKPQTTGAEIINNYELARDLLRTFDGDGDGRNAIQAPRPTQAWVDERELRQRGHTVGDIARYLMNYTLRDNTVNPSALPPGNGSKRLFSAAFPGSVLEGLSCT
ncbi:MAG: alkaline phosphatase family protein [Actinomycetota bacterium]